MELKGEIKWIFVVVILGLCVSLIDPFIVILTRDLVDPHLYSSLYYVLSFFLFSLIGIFVGSKSNLSKERVRLICITALWSLTGCFFIIFLIFSYILTKPGVIVAINTIFFLSYFFGAIICALSGYYAARYREIYE